MIFKILELFVNPSSANSKYALLNRGNLLEHFQIRLSQKQKIFSIFFPFSKFRFNFEHFENVEETDTLYEWLYKCANSPV